MKVKNTIRRYRGIHAAANANVRDEINFAKAALSAALRSAVGDKSAATVHTHTHTHTQRERMSI